MSKFALRPAKSGGYVVELDGADISNTVSGVDLHVDANTNVPTIQLSITAFVVDTETEARVCLTPGTDDLLIQLGWTPPAEDAS